VLDWYTVISVCVVCVCGSNVVYMKWTCLLILGLCGCHRDVLLMDNNDSISDIREQNWNEAVRQGLVSTNNAPLTSAERERAVEHALSQWCITNIPNFLP
jgi:hypothetical protein